MLSKNQELLLDWRWWLRKNSILVVVVVIFTFAVKQDKMNEEDAERMKHENNENSKN